MNGNNHTKKIYTHDIAAQLVELFEDVLIKHKISVPSPEDDERDPDDKLGLYGTTYSDLLEAVESCIVSVLSSYDSANTEIIQDRFS